MAAGLARWLGGRRWAAGLLLGSGFAAGHLALNGPGPLPPRESWQWLLPLALLSPILGLAEGVSWRAWTARALAASAVAATALHFLSWPWRFAWLGLLAPGFLLHERASRLPGRGYPVLLAMGWAAGSVALFLSGSQLLALEGGALAGAALGWALLPGQVRESVSAVPAAVLLGGTLLAVGCAVSEMRPCVALLLWAIPAAAWIPAVRVRLAAVAALGAGACLWAWAASPPLDF